MRKIRDVSISITYSTNLGLTQVAELWQAGEWDRLGDVVRIEISEERE